MGAGSEPEKQGESGHHRKHREEHRGVILGGARRGQARWVALPARALPVGYDPATLHAAIVPTGHAVSGPLGASTPCASLARWAHWCLTSVNHPHAATTNSTPPTA